MKQARRGPARGRGYAVVLAILIGVAPGVARAADETPPLDIGRSVVVVNDVDTQLGSAPPKRLVINDDIVFNEDITTATDAKTVIEFRDGSSFEVGPNAVVRIDSFVFNPEEGISRKTLNIGRGVFRYVSGYVAGDQSTTITAPVGTLAIRGSDASGLVAADVPVFVYLAQGEANFTNDGGSVALQQGNSIAVPTRTTRPMPPAAMPPAVAAQALQAIARRLPPDTALQAHPAATEAWLRQAGAANLMPAAEQERREAASRATRPLSAGGGAPGGIAREVGLLTEGHAVHLFDGAQGTRNAAQQAFIARAARVVPNAQATLDRSFAAARSLHTARTEAGTAAVIRSVALAAPSSAVLSRVAAAAVRANPAAAGLITRTSLSTYRGANRREFAGQLRGAIAGAGRTGTAAGAPIRSGAASPARAERGRGNDNRAETTRSASGERRAGRGGGERQFGRADQRRDQARRGVRPGAAPRDGRRFGNRQPANRQPSARGGQQRRQPPGRGRGNRRDDNR